METTPDYTTGDNAPATMDSLEDASNDHAYFSMMPNMLDDLLDPYQYRLYAHFKRVCGEHGKCWQSTETIAKVCKMSTGKVSEAKQELAEMGLITITEKARKNGGWPYHHIKVVDIWNRNIIHCSPRPSSLDEQASSLDETKKTPCFKKTPEQVAAAPHAPPAEEWPTEPAEQEPKTPPQNPAEKRKAEMRARFGGDPLSVAAHCQKAQEQEGTWTVPVHHGLSPACAVFKEATGYRPGTASRPVIDETIPNNEEALQAWFKTCQGWMLTYDNHKNVAGMLDWYAEGRVGRDKPNKANGGASTGRSSGGGNGPVIAASTLTFGGQNANTTV